MNFKGHKEYGLKTSWAVAISYLLFFTTYNYTITEQLVFSKNLFAYSGILFIATFIGSLSPDLDIESIPSQWVARIMVAYWVAVLWLNSVLMGINSYIGSELSVDLNWKPAAILSLIFFVCKGDHHRGWTHALIWTPILLATAYFTGFHIIGAFGIGMAVHNWYCDDISMLRVRNWF